MYVASAAGNTISVVDGVKREVVATITRPAGGVPAGLAVDSGANLLYDLDSALDKVLVWKKVGSVYQTVASVPIPPTPRGIAVNEVLHRVYVVTDPSSGPGKLTVISGPSSTVSAQVSLFAGDPTGQLAVNVDKDVVYATIANVPLGATLSGALAVVRGDIDQLVSFPTITKGPLGVGVDQAERRVFVSQRDADRVLALPLDDDGFLAPAGPAATIYGLDVGALPGPIAVNQVSNRVYVLSPGSGPLAAGPNQTVSGTITVLEPQAPQYQVGERIGVGRTSQALAIDMANHRIFVANAGGPGFGPIAASPGSVSVVSRFDPLAHGFHFVNSFSTPGLGATLPLVGQVNFGAVPFGLCGGMVFGALDSYYAGGRAPANVTPPGAGSQLRGYLYNRLLDTLLPDNAAVLRRFVKWMALPLHDTPLVTGLVTRTNREFVTKIHPGLLNGPVPLGVVKASFDATRPDFVKVWTNHQVLAIGDFQNERGQWVVETYDPNIPNRSVYLQIDRRVETSDPEGKSVVTRFRGLFAIDGYRLKHPYWVPPSG